MTLQKLKPARESHEMDTTISLADWNLLGKYKTSLRHSVPILAQRGSWEPYERSDEHSKHRTLWSFSLEVSGKFFRYYFTIGYPLHTGCEERFFSFNSAFSVWRLFCFKFVLSLDCVRGLFLAIVRQCWSDKANFEFFAAGALSQIVCSVCSALFKSNATIMLVFNFAQVCNEN